jgi:hypothetical protein
MQHMKTPTSPVNIRFKHILLFVCILLWGACKNCDCPENKNQPEQIKKKEASTLVTPTQLIFTDFGRCLMNSGKTEMIWYGTYPVVDDEEIEGQESPKKGKDNGIKILGRLTNPNAIYKFIDSLPDLSESPNEIMSVRVSSYSYLIFICDKDTLVSFSWDPGRGQINVNNRWWFKFDFDKLYKQLDKIKTSEKINQ